MSAGAVLLLPIAAHAAQWLPAGASLKQATQALMVQECVWCKASVGNASWDMCTYPANFDRHLSRVIQAHGCVECDDVAFSLMQLASGGGGRTLKAPPMLIDLGANIGMYSLAAAAAGNAVIAFEPMPTNAMRLLASVRKNSFQARFHLVSVCVSDEPGTHLCQLGLNPSNQGHLRHQIGSSSSSSTSSAPSNGGSAGSDQQEAARSSALGGGGLFSSGASLLTSAAVRVDDVLPPQTTRSVFLKVDLEGHECRAFRGMTRLLNESTRILGAVVEFDKSHSCCAELIRPPFGAFHLLHTRQRLCPVPSGIGSGGGSHAGGGKAEVSLAALCRLSSGSRQLNVRWKRCSGPVQ